MVLQKLNSQLIQTSSFPKIKFYGIQDIDKLPQLKTLSEIDRLAMKAVAMVLPFRTNNYVVESLIDWNNIPEDPIFRLTFPQAEMLSYEDLNILIALIKNNTSPDKINHLINQIRYRLNPHPSGQKEYNIPIFDNEIVPGVQHKYPETVLIFPASGQVCHAYCTFCFRWPQFVGIEDLKFATRESGLFQDYLHKNRGITDVLITGGDPLVMSAKQLSRYIEPLLEPEFDHIQTIRIGTKSVAYWPYRFVTDTDADDLLRLFERVVCAGKHLAIMGHYSHWQELETEISQKAIRRIRMTGAEIRTQSPLLRYINDSPEVWSKMWQIQVNLGCIPYYCFVERNTGSHHYFSLPLVRTWEIFREAFQKVSGLGRTVRGPVMSSLPGKIVIDGVTEIRGEKIFVLSFLQGRDPNWCKQPFFAQYNPNATWLSDLKPAFGEKKFFFEDRLKELLC